VTADAPVSHWRLEEASGTAMADARAANAGAYVNAPALGQAGLIAESGSRSVRFDGVNDHGRVSSSASLAFGSAFTLEAWIKPAALPAAGYFASILSKPEAYSLQFNGPRLEFTVIQNGTRRRLQAAVGAIQTGVAYHVVGTYDGANQRLYIDGAQAVTRAQTGAASTVSYGLYVGSWDGTGEFFTGQIDEVAVYNKVLTATRVKAHSDAGRPAGRTASLTRAGRVGPLRKTKNAQRRTQRRELRAFRLGLKRHLRATKAGYEPLCTLEQADKKRLEAEPVSYRRD
jgi:hypothetical protein